VEGWRQKELERQEVVRQLQLEKHTVQEAFESQQQVSSRLADLDCGSVTDTD